MVQNTNNNLPPKSCTIDKLVTIDKDINKVITGAKTATRRNRRYADIGEEMVLKGKQFIVHNVYSQKLKDMNDQDAIDEGYSNFEQYKESILSIHPGMKWNADMKVWVHEYKPV